MCPECGSGASAEEWVCQECLGATKSQTKKLLSFLQDDFGFSEGISLNFSGSKGFHIHVRGTYVRGLSKPARLELLDYITATNLDVDVLGFFYNKTKNSFICPKKNEAKGWSKRILDSVVAALEKNDISKIAVMGNITTAAAGKLLKEKPNILHHMGNGLLAFSTKGIDANKFWRHFTTFAISEEKIGLEVDRQTSIDINKIIRVPNTIHGGTGLLAKEFSVEQLGSFQPLDDSIAMAEAEIKVQNAVAPRFYLNRKWFGPYAGDEVSLPLYAAFYLLARGNADISD